MGLFFNWLVGELVDQREARDGSSSSTISSYFFNKL